MCVLSHLSTLVLVGEDLGFALSSSADGRHFELVSVHVSVCNLVAKEVLLGSAVNKNDRFISPNDFALSILLTTVNGHNLPHGAVHLLVNNTNLLVSRESSVGLGRDGD